MNENKDEKVQINGVVAITWRALIPYTSALYWRDNEREYLLIYLCASDFGGRLDKETLIAIAESLR